MMRCALALLFVVHGIAQVSGFLTSWRLASLEGLACKTTLWAGRVDVGIRIVGVFWLLAALGFLVAGIGTTLALPWWGTLTAVVASFSLALSVLEWTEAKVAVAVNLVILVYLGVAAQPESSTPRQGG